MRASTFPTLLGRGTMPRAVRVLALAVLLAVPILALSGWHPTTTAPPIAPARPTVSALPPTAAHDRAGAVLRAGSLSSSDWPEFHQNSRLSGDASASNLSTKNASHLGVRWATDLYSAALDSPVVAYDVSLGETLAYVGTESGDVLAVNLANGHVVWGTWLGAAIRSTPAVSGGAVFVGTSANAALFKLNATTGAVLCSALSPLPIEGSPTVMPSSHGNATVVVGTLDWARHTGPMIAMDAGNCSIDWEFTGYPRNTGSWDAVASAVNATGVRLVLFGTSDPDAAVYALNAATGAEVWRFQTYNPPPGAYDVGAGVTVSPPGALGFAHGVAFVPNKYGIMYALDLSTGKKIWSVNFNQIAGTTEGGRSTAALAGENLVFGFKTGLFDLNASTGAVVWKYLDRARAEALSSPAIVGPLGTAVVVVGDIGGAFDVVSLANGTELYHYQTGGYITASPAVDGGNVVLCSTDGFLYDFAVGGGNDPTLPATTITSPADAATLANPNGNARVSGTASDPHGLAGVTVAVETDGPTGPWWDSVTGTWVPGPTAGAATLNLSSNGTSGSWTFAFPVPAAGGTYEVHAYATATSGQSDIRGASVGFSVNFSAKGPHVRTTSSYVPPGGSTTVLGGGFGATENVTFRLGGSVLATRVSSSTGYVAAFPLHVPTGAAFGLSSLVATGLASGRSAAATIVVGNSWEQSGYSATHLAFEPTDAVLDHLITPGNKSWVDLAWHFDAGAAVNASPAVVNGVAYVADTVGTIYALDIHNGGLVWSWTNPSGSAFNGSPAVDPTQGLVFLTTQDGVVYALGLSNGTELWTATVGGGLTAPVFASGTLYIGSRNGTVDALSESTGAGRWNLSLGSAVLAPPTLDAGHFRLFVGDVAGDLLALNSSTGVRVWTYAAGGAIVASPTVYGSRVYLGSANGNVTSLRESSGATVWSYHTGGAVSAPAALSHSGTPLGSSLELLVGSGDGYLYALNATGGSLNYAVAVGAPIVGLAAAEGVVAFATASGLVGAARTYTNLTIWNFPTGAGLSDAPVIVDGTIYVAAQDGFLYALTPYGQPPL